MANYILLREEIICSSLRGASAAKQSRTLGSTPAGLVSATGVSKFALRGAGPFENGNMNFNAFN